MNMALDILTHASVAFYVTTVLIAAMICAVAMSHINNN